MMHGTIIYYSKSRLEACSQPKCMSSPTQFPAEVLEYCIHPVLQNWWNRRQKQSCNSDNCKNGNDNAGQSTDIEWHVCPGGTSEQILHRLQEFMLENQARTTIFVSMFIDITKWESQNVARFRAVCWCFGGPASDKTWNFHEERPSHRFAEGEWD